MCVCLSRSFYVSVPVCLFISKAFLNVFNFIPHFICKHFVSHVGIFINPSDITVLMAEYLHMILTIDASYCEINSPTWRCLIRGMFL